MPDDEELEVRVLGDSSDVRGWSYSVTEHELGLIDRTKDVHIAAIRPGCIRGNHYHMKRGELITVIHRDTWSLHWDTGENTPAHHRTFNGSGALAFAPPRGWSHAVRNDGSVDLIIVASNDVSYNRHEQDEVSRDAYRRIVTE